MNIIEFLKENEVEYWTQGKNVSAGYVNIQCMYCDDTSNHLGIRLSDLHCNCWKCGRKGITKIIQKILDSSYKEAKAVVKSLEHSPQEVEERIIKRPTQLELPGSDTFPSIHIEYLKSRGFEPIKIIKKYKLKACYRSGRYKYRIIIPIYFNKRLVSFTSRDITDEANLKYDSCSDKDSLLPFESLLFNLDSVDKGGDAMMPEGPFDVMKLGDNSFCFLGVALTPQRILSIAEKKINNLYIFFDPDQTGERESKKAAALLAPHVRKAHILKLKRSKAGINISGKQKTGRLKLDPGELSHDQVLAIRKTLGFKN